ncbi:Non-reducing polyketide synthase nscA [Cladobotryum mycophilum]|uniref:Non-reducing polyketide synthase nscA n=1 Tax=Cladobotryum mycophilum TaxID=491253 RepID=A0ABR0SWM6_9HYPO
MDVRDVHSKVSLDRFDRTTYFELSGKIPNTTETPYGNFIDNPGYFDAAFFNMSPREAEQTDPIHRLALVTAYEALEMSGYSLNRTPSTSVKRLLHAAGVSPLDVGHMELHGAGTQTGDTVESESVATVFAPLTRRRRPDQRLHLGAVKANIGHGVIPLHLNAGLVLEDAPTRAHLATDPRGTHVVALSAKSKHSLRGNAQALLQFLEKQPDTSLGDLAYTLAARRIHHPVRLAIAVSSTEELLGILTNAVHTIDEIRPVPSTPPAVVFAFTGQGAFDDGISTPRRGPLCAEESDAAPGVVSSVDTQLAILVVEIALSRLCLGEYAALVTAGVLSATDARFLAGKRAQLVEACCNPSECVMLSVRASVNDIKSAVGNISFKISCLNGPQDTAISGRSSDMIAIRTTLESKGFKCIHLDLPFAFYTAQMEPLLTTYEEVACHVTFKAPRMPILSPLLGDYLGRATREPVNFVDAVKAAYETDIIDDQTVWVDISPHPACGAFVRSVFLGATTVSSIRRNEDNFKALAGALARLHREGVPVEWNEYLRLYERAHQLLNLPAYCWNEKNYWIQYKGTWTLDKAYPPRKRPRDQGQGSSSSIQTPSVQQVITKEMQGEWICFYGNGIVIRQLPTSLLSTSLHLREKQWLEVNKHKQERGDFYKTISTSATAINFITEDMPPPKKQRTSSHTVPSVKANAKQIPPSPTVSDNSTVEKYLRLIAQEMRVERSSLTDDASFIELGIDSLMSLVLSEKFRMELDLEIKNTVFLECPNIAELKAWISECC